MTIFPFCNSILRWSVKHVLVHEQYHYETNLENSWFTYSVPLSDLITNHFYSKNRSPNIRLNQVKLEITLFYQLCDKMYDMLWQVTIITFERLNKLNNEQMRKQIFYKFEGRMPKSFMMKSYLLMFLMLVVGLWPLFYFGPWIPINTTHSVAYQLKSSSSWQCPEIHNKKRKKVSKPFKSFV